MSNVSSTLSKIFEFLERSSSDSFKYSINSRLFPENPIKFSHIWWRRRWKSYLHSNFSLCSHNARVRTPFFKLFWSIIPLFCEFFSVKMTKMCEKLWFELNYFSQFNQNKEFWQMSDVSAIHIFSDGRYKSCKRCHGAPIVLLRWHADSECVLKSC